MSSSKQENSIGEFFSLLGIGFSVVGGTILYSAWRDRYVADFIKKTPYTDLETLQKMNLNENPIYVKLVGKSFSNNFLQTEISKKPAVIYERKKIGVWYTHGKKEDPTSQWIEDTFRKEEPWYISKDKSGENFWINSFDAQNPPLQEVFRSEITHGNYLGSFILGIIGFKYPHKYITKEYSLEPATQLLVLGNVFKDKNGKFNIIKPKSGIFVPHSPGIISDKTEEEILEDLMKNHKSKNILGSILTTVGLISLFGGLTYL